MTILALLLFAQNPPESLESVLERLKTEDLVQRRAAQEDLLKRGAEGVAAALRVLEAAAPALGSRVEELVRALSSPKWRERDRAVRDLVALGRYARAVLEKHSGSPDPEVAWRVKAALAELNEKAGQDERLEEVRALALCELLGEAGDGRAAGPLLRILGAGTPDQKPDLKFEAAEAVSKLRAHLDAAQAEEASERVLGLLERTQAPGPKALLLKALARLGSPACVRPLAALLADRSEKNLNLKRNCMAALVASGSAHGLKAVVGALASDDVYLREGASAILARAGADLAGFDPRAGAAENRAALEKVRAWGEKKFGRAWEE